MLSVECIRAFAALFHDNINMSQKSKSSEMIKLCINILNSDNMTTDEKSLGYFTRKKLKTLSTWHEWIDRETKQIDQLHMQKIFGYPIDPIGLPESAVILDPHWQYRVK